MSGSLWPSRSPESVVGQGRRHLVVTFLDDACECRISMGVFLQGACLRPWLAQRSLCLTDPVKPLASSRRTSTAGTTSVSAGVFDKKEQLMSKFADILLANASTFSEASNSNRAWHVSSVKKKTCLGSQSSLGSN